MCISLTSNYTRTPTNSFIKSGSPTRVVKMQSASKLTHMHTSRGTGREVCCCASALLLFRAALSHFLLSHSLSFSSSCAAVHLSLCCYLIDSLLLPLLFLLSLLVQLLLSAFKHIGYTCSLCKAATVTGSTGVGAVVQSYCPAHCAHTHTHTATLYMGNLCEKRCQNMHWHVCVCGDMYVCM